MSNSDECRTTEGNGVVARLPPRRSKGHSRSATSITSVSMRERIAELDRYVGISALGNGGDGQSSLCGEWAAPSTEHTTPSDNAVSSSVHSEESNQTSSLPDKSCTSTRSSLMDEQPVQLDLNQQQQQQQQQMGIVEPWQLCPPVANNGHKCPHCSAGYTSKAGLRRHIETKHPELLSGATSSKSLPNQSSSSKAGWQCELCSRLFYHRSTLARHYIDAHPNYQPPFLPIAQNQSQPPPVITPLIGLNQSNFAMANGVLPQIPVALAPQIFPAVNHDAVAAAAAALHLGIHLPYAGPPAFHHLPASIRSTSPAAPFLPSAPGATAFPFQSRPPILQDENSMHRLSREGTPSLIALNSNQQQPTNFVIPPEITSLKPLPCAPEPEQTDNTPSTASERVECIFCAKLFPNTNPALIFHQVLAHKIAIESFKLSPPNFINCPDCSLPLNAKDPGFPNHNCRGPKSQQRTSSTGLLNTDQFSSMLCDRCGQVLHNEDAYVAHRENRHGLHDCTKCHAVLASHDALAKHTCQEVAPICLSSPGRSVDGVNSLSKKNNSSVWLCPLCTDRFTAKGVLAEHVTNYHRTDFVLFDKNGPFYLGGFDVSIQSIFQRRQQSSGTLSSPSTTLQSPSSSPENEVPITTTSTTTTATGQSIEQLTSSDLIQTDEQTISSSSLTKRRPLALRASAADKWRHVDGFRCDHCRATFLTTQSRAQHVRWRHPEMVKSDNPHQSTPEKQETTPSTNLSDSPSREASSNVVTSPKSSPSKNRPAEDFDCPICGSSYISARSRAQHIRWSHPGVPLPDVSMVSPTISSENNSEIPPISISDSVSPPMTSSSASGRSLDAATLMSLAGGFKGSCEICGVQLANSQGRSQHLRHKHPEAWSALRKNLSDRLDNNVKAATNKDPNDISPVLQLSDPEHHDGLNSSADMDDLGDENGIFPCVLCDKTFPSKRGRGRHYYWIHQRREKDYTGPLSRKTLGARVTGGSPSSEVGTLSSQRWFTCSRCPKRFLRRVGLSIHTAQAHRRQKGDVQTGETSSTQNAAESSVPPPSTPIRSASERLLSKKTPSPSATARCLICESCFPHQSDVIRHLLDTHNISEPTDAHWVWAITHTDLEDSDDEGDVEDGDFVREPLLQKQDELPPDLTCAPCHKSFPNELLFRGHMLLEHQVNYSTSSTSVASVQPATSNAPSPDVAASSSNISTHVPTDVIRCSDCNKEFASLRALHIHEHHTQHGPHRPGTKQNVVSCINCPDQPVFNSGSELQIHQQRKHKPFRCTRCNVGLIGHDAFRAHQCQVNTSRKRVADVEVIDLDSSGDSGKTPANSRNSNVARRNSFPTEPININADAQCEVCKRLFNSTRALHIHQKMSCLRGSGSIGNKRLAAERPPAEVVVINSPEHSPDSDIAEVFPCDLCEETFSRPQGLACHKRSRHNYVSMSPRCIASRQKHNQRSSTSNGPITATQEAAVGPATPQMSASASAPATEISEPMLTDSISDVAPIPDPPAFSEPATPVKDSATPAKASQPPTPTLSATKPSVEATSNKVTAASRPVLAKKAPNSATKQTVVMTGKTTVAPSSRTAPAEKSSTAKPPKTMADAPSLKFTCRLCKANFPKKFGFIEHTNTKSECSKTKSKLLLAYQRRVYGAIRQKLPVNANVGQRRRELVEKWLSRIEQKSAPRALKPEAPAPEPAPAPVAAQAKQTVQAPPSTPPAEKRTRSSNRKPPPTPKRSPGQRTSPLLSKEKAAKTETTKKSKKDAAVAEKQQPKTTKKGKKEKVEVASSVSSSSSAAPAPAPPPPGMNRCAMCGREFPTPVQLMIHYCRDNCAGQAKQQPPTAPEPAKHEAFIRPAEVTEQRHGSLSSSSSRLSVGTEAVPPAAVPHLLPPATGAELSSSISSIASSSSSSAPAPARKVRMKRPTFDEGDDSNNKPTQAFV